MIEALLEIVVTVIGELLEDVLTRIFSKARLPKWLQITLLIVLTVTLLGGLIWGFIYGLSEMGLAGILACLGVMAFPFVIWFICAQVVRWRYGRLRLAKKEDLPEILRMYRSVIGRPGCTWSISYPNEATLHEDFCTNNLYVLKKGQKLVGSGSVVPENELDDLLCWYYRENAREIARIVIDPNVQGKGHGKFLVQRLCRTLRKSGCKSVHLLPSVENKHAQQMYQMCGFSKRYSCHRYGHDFYAYERKLCK